jgi:hypothetical protein
MKLLYFLLLASGVFCLEFTFAQSDTTYLNNNPVPATHNHRDSLNLARLNTTSNLLMAAGAGLFGAGIYLDYEGALIYKTPAAPTSTNPAGDVERNHNQGAAYLTCGVISIGAGAVLLAFGIKDKLLFKRRMKKMQLESGLLQNGNLGATLTF